MRMRKGLALFLVYLITLQTSVAAWDDIGHMAVAYVAYQHLNAATRARVSVLLKLNPDYHKWLANIPNGTPASQKRLMIFMQAATWPDAIRREAGYKDDGTDGGDRPDGVTSVQNIGYSDHLHHKYWHFVDTPFSRDGTPLPATPTPNAETQITAFRAVLASTDPDEKKSYDLVWLEHLVGDVHQPLHAVTRVTGADPAGDRGGNRVELCAPPCKNELHAFWDDALGTGNSVVHGVRVGQALPAPNASLSAKKDATVWVNESFDIAQQTVYESPIGPANGPYTVTASYRRTAKKLAQQRVALAGARLANLLNQELK